MVFLTGTLELQRYQRVVQVLQAPAFIGEMAMLVDVLPDARCAEHLHACLCRVFVPCVVRLASGWPSPLLRSSVFFTHVDQ